MIWVTLAFPLLLVLVVAIALFRDRGETRPYDEEIVTRLSEYRASLVATGRREHVRGHVWAAVILSLIIGAGLSLRQFQGTADFALHLVIYSPAIALVLVPLFAFAARWVFDRLTQTETYYAASWWVYATCCAVLFSVPAVPRTFEGFAVVLISMFFALGAILVEVHTGGLPSLRARQSSSPT